MELVNVEESAVDVFSERMLPTSRVDARHSKQYATRLQRKLVGGTRLGADVLHLLAVGARIGRADGLPVHVTLSPSS